MKELLARFCAWGGTRRRATSFYKAPSQFGVPFEDINFPSANPDGVRLSGWLLPSQQQPARGVIILCHGHGSTRANMLSKAIMLNRHHFTTLIFDFRARGLSAGNLCTLGDRETDDVLGAVQFLKSRIETRKLPLGALGESMGGSAVLCAAARDNRIDAVVAEGAFATLNSVLRHRFKFMFGPLSSTIADSCMELGAREFGIEVTRINPVDEIARICPRPILLIHDGLDIVCPKGESDQLLSHAQEPKDRWIVPAAPHVAAFKVAPQAYEKKLSTFFMDNLKS